jgi:ferredoxin-nitrite reductase
VEFLRPHGELNQVERWKLARHPLDVWQAVVDTYSNEGPEAIEAVEGEAERLKWVGLYPQRQGGDAFMLRIKVPGGRLTTPQAALIGELAGTYARGPEPNPVFGDGYLDITTRQDIQMHWVTIAAVPEIWRRLEEVGITTLQACGDSARNVLCCPVAGIDADEVFDAYPVATAVSHFFTGNREYANLPRKFKISVTGCREDCVEAEINDIGLWPARRPDGVLGFNVLVGGGLSDGPRMASDIDVFVAPDQAVELCRGVAQVFGELGNRENRGVCRMRYLVQELGAEGFRAALAARTAFPLATAGEALTRRHRGDHVGVHRQSQPGLSYVGCNVVVGRMTGSELTQAAHLAAEYGSGELRLTTDQSFVIPGVPDDRVDELVAAPLLARHSPHPGPFARGAVACTGSEFCRFAIVETKARTARWARDLDARLSAAGNTGNGNGGNGNGMVGDRNGHRREGVIRLHFSGCPASCAQPQIADIGLRGETAQTADGIVEAADIGLGGSLGLDAGFIDFVVGALPVDQVPDALVRLVQRYRGQRLDGEEFHEWCRRLPNAELRDIITAVPSGAGA